MVTVISILYGCFPPEKQQTEVQIDWATLCVKEPQITDSEINEFAKSINDEFIDILHLKSSSIVLTGFMTFYL